MIQNGFIEPLQEYIAEHYHSTKQYAIIRQFTQSQYANDSFPFTQLRDHLLVFIGENRTSKTFSVLLNELRQKRGLSPQQLYEGALIDRRVYSKIMGNRFYRPSKNTVIAFGLSLHLELSEMRELLSSAGFSLSCASIFDLTIMFCCENHIYNVFDVNALLIQMNQKVLV